MNETLKSKTENLIIDTPNNTCVTVYSYDKHGHYVKADVTIKDPVSGKVLLPPDCVEFAPDEDKLKTNWAVLNDDKTAWEYIAKPATAEDLLGITIEHSDQCNYAIEMREYMRSLVGFSNENYKLVQEQGTNDLHVEKITHTAEELLATAKEKALRNLQADYSKYTTYNSSTVSYKTSLGYVVNGDRSSVDNLTMLINSLENGTDTITYRLFDNTYTGLTKVQLVTIKTEISDNLLAKAQEYSSYKDKINACTIVEEVESITW